MEEKKITAAVVEEITEFAPTVIPGRLYTISEIVKMDLGLTRYELSCATRISGQNYATRMGSGKGSTWRFDLKKYLDFRNARYAG